MTWHKLFLWRVTPSLPVLGVAWVSSLWYRTDLRINPYRVRISVAH